MFLALSATSLRSIRALVITPPYTTRRYTSTGWINAYWDGARSLPWSQPGAAADCAAAYSAYTLFNVTPNGVYGTVSRTVALPPLLVQGWLANGGAANYGLLLR